MIISNSKNFIFFKPRKVAGTSIETYLNPFLDKNVDIATKLSDFDSKFDDTSYDTSEFNAEGYYNHMYPTKLLRKIGPIKYFNYFKFTVIRNPFDTLVSLYKYKNPNIGFEDFILNSFIDNTPYYYLTFKRQPIFKSCDYYIRFENLKQDFDFVCNKLNIPIMELPKTKNKYRGDSDDYRNYYNDVTRRLVERKNSLILNKFDYKF